MEAPMEENMNIQMKTCNFKHIIKLQPKINKYKILLKVRYKNLIKKYLEKAIVLTKNDFYKAGEV